MTDFIREVDEDLRQDRFKAFLTRYWPVLVVLVVLILGGVGTWKAYDHITTQKAEQASSRYLDALDAARDGKDDAAIADLKAVEGDGTPGYRLLARLRLAGETKDPAAAAAMFDAIAADAAVDPAIQAISKLRAAALLVDRLPYADFKARVAPLSDANSPVRNPARELLALAALKADKLDDAAQALDAITVDPTTSGTQRQRAQVLLGLVHGAGAVPPPAPVAPSPAPKDAPAPVTPSPPPPAAPAPAPGAPQP